jgi:hypothetical protein
MNADERTKNINLRKQQIKERNDNDIKVVTEKPEGRRLYFRFLEACETFLSKDSTKQARDAGMEFFKNIMRVAPDKFLQMHREHKSERISIEKQFPLSPEDDDED